jgi:hypothetical protein
MKNSIVIMFTICFMADLSGQCLSETNTNPASPKNTELTSLMPVGGVNEFRNTYFNWGSNANTSFNSIVLNMNAGWSFSHNGLMHSPYSLNMPKQYSYLSQNGALPADCDWQWENGWELMWLNLGRYPNGEGVETTNSQRIISSARGLSNPATPYFVLYNRYSGKLRFFGNLFQALGGTNNDQINLAVGHLKNGEKVSGVFRHLGSYDRPLDQKTVFQYASSSNANPGNNNAWFSSDFQLGFDPCVCDYKTTWDLEYQLITSWKVDLQGRSVSATLPVNEFDDNYLTNTSILKEKSAGGGSILYKKLGSMYDDYETEMAAYEKKLAIYNKPENQIAREVVSLAKKLAVDGTLGALVPTEGAKKLVTKYMGKLNEKFDAKNAEKMAEGIKSTSESLLGKGFDFLSKQIVGSDFMNAPVKPTMPTATFSEMTIVGEITHSNPASITGLYNPGSFKPGVHQIDPFSYPIYNKPVGLFALLRTPSIQLGEKGVYDKSSSWAYNTGDFGPWSDWQISWGFFNRSKRSKKANFDVVYTQRFKQDIYFKLKDKLLYRFNHNVDFDFTKTKTMVTFEIELESDCADPYYYDNVKYGTDKSHKVDISNSNMIVKSHFVKTNSSNEKLVLTTDWEEITNSAEQLFGGQLTVDASFKIQSGIITLEQTMETHMPTGRPPFSTIKEEYIYKTTDVIWEMFDWEGNILDQTSQMKYFIKKIKMKLMPQMQFKQLGSNGGKISTTQVFTYLIYDKDKGVDLIEAKGERIAESDLSKLVKYKPGTLTLNNEEIKTTSPYVTSVSGNIINVNAEYIKLSGSIAVQPGYEAHLTAYKSIETEPSTTITPECVLDINLNFYGLGSTTEATDEQVTAFCKGTNKEYAADQSASSVPELKQPTDNSNEFSAKSSNSNFAFSIYPNPSDQTTEIHCHASEDGDYLLSVMDLSGRQIMSKPVKILNGKNMIALNTLNLSNGMYFVTISNQTRRATQKLLVNHNE